jgi:hypothetical protein
MQMGRYGAQEFFFSDFTHCENHRRGQGRYLLEQERPKKDFNKGKLIQTVFQKNTRIRR